MENRMFREDEPLVVEDDLLPDEVRELLRLTMRSRNVYAATEAINLGADPNECGPNDNPAGETALTLAITTESREMVTFALSCQDIIANKLVSGSDGSETALDRVLNMFVRTRVDGTRDFCTHVAPILMEHGATVNSGKALFRACHNGVLEQLVNDCALPKAVLKIEHPDPTRTYRTLFLYACAYSDRETVGYLLKELGLQYCLKNDTSDELGGPIHAAAAEGNAGVVRFLCGELKEEGLLLVDAKSRDRYGLTPLYRAALDGHWHTVLVLEEFGANLDATVSCGMRIVHFACGDPEVIKTDMMGILHLVKRLGADTNVANDKGNTPLHFACTWSDGSRSLALKEVLLKWGADPLAVNQAGDTPLSMLASQGYLDDLFLLVRSDACIARITEISNNLLIRNNRAKLQCAADVGPARVGRIICKKKIQRVEKEYTTDYIL